MKTSTKEFAFLCSLLLGGVCGLRAASVLAQPAIGPADGTTYTISSSSEERHMDSACGFNDLGVPNAAKYTVEKRHYEKFSNGTLVDSWDKTVEVFSGCDQ